jgi:hypothetical protein
MGCICLRWDSAREFLSSNKVLKLDFTPRMPSAVYPGTKPSCLEFRSEFISVISGRRNPGLLRTHNTFFLQLHLREQKDSQCFFFAETWKDIGNEWKFNNARNKRCSKSFWNYLVYRYYLLHSVAFLSFYPSFRSEPQRKNYPLRRNKLFEIIIWTDISLFHN